MSWTQPRCIVVADLLLPRFYAANLPLAGVAVASVAVNWRFLTVSLMRCDFPFCMYMNSCIAYPFKIKTPQWVRRSDSYEVRTAWSCECERRSGREQGKVFKSIAGKRTVQRGGKVKGWSGNNRFVS